MTQQDAREALAARFEGTVVPRNNGRLACEMSAVERDLIVASLRRQPAATWGEPRELVAARENLREAWVALAMIRETVETLAPSGAVTGAEYLDGPTFTHEADALVEGIIAIRSSTSDDRAKVVEEALRDAFPHFQSDEPISAEAIRSIGREYADMVMGWEPQKDEIEFIDHNGKTHKIINESGDYEVGIYPGWVLSDDSDLVSRALSPSTPHTKKGET